MEHDRFAINYAAVTQHLRDSGFKDNHIKHALVDRDVQKELRKAKDSTAVYEIATYAARQIDRRLEEESRPRNRMCDFDCPVCGYELRDELCTVYGDESHYGLKFGCPQCQTEMTNVTRRGPMIFSDEKPPKDLLDSARDGIVRVRGRREFERFDGSSRSDIRNWMERNNLDAMTGTEADRGNGTINSAPPKFTKSKGFVEQLAENVSRTAEIVEAKGDMYEEAKAAIDRPNEFDKNAFKQQATSGAIGSDAESYAEEI